VTHDADVRLDRASVGYPNAMALWIVLIVVIVAVLVGLALWARSRRRGGVIATKPSRPPRADGEP
jgi:uncharacterized iron-regulated membrane protein